MMKIEPSSYKHFSDAKNLYSLTRCQKLPYKDIKCVDGFPEEEITRGMILM